MAANDDGELTSGEHGHVGGAANSSPPRPAAPAARGRAESPAPKALASVTPQVAGSQMQGRDRFNPRVQVGRPASWPSSDLCRALVIQWAFILFVALLSATQVRINFGAGSALVLSGLTLGCQMTLGFAKQRRQLSPGVYAVFVLLSALLGLNVGLIIEYALYCFHVAGLVSSSVSLGTLLGLLLFISCMMLAGLVVEAHERLEQWSGFILGGAVGLLLAAAGTWAMLGISALGAVALATTFAAAICGGVVSDAYRVVNKHDIHDWKATLLELSCFEP